MKKVEMQMKGDLYNIFILTNFFERLRGVIGRGKDEKIFLFPRCNSIHTFFVRFPLDVFFLNRSLEVLKVISGLLPNRWAFGGRNAYFCLEVFSGVYPELELSIGDKLVLKEDRK